MAKIQSTNIIKCRQACGTTGTLLHCWGNAKGYSHFGRQFISYKAKHAPSHNLAILLSGIYP